ncbi:MAG: hypothetical protein JWN67_4599 [Actinomycetia bacterium]|nr:hypothetical protein [Actinomycetes bacterium]
MNLHRISHGLLAAALSIGFLAGCSSSSAAPAADAATTTTATATAASPSDFCAAFADLAASGGGSLAARDAAGWAENIAIITRLAEAAPDEISAQADAYVTMAHDRAELAADNGYVGVEDLPADVRAKFTTSHADLQAQVNELLADAKDACS